MSTYIDHYSPFGGRLGGGGKHVVHSWADYTDARLAWLYGPDHATTRAHQSLTDVAAWNALGRRSAA